ncbi:MAG TPA: transglutaminase family protein [Acidimicrobiia bacterium]|nr:transglutaminase family protein [Acidimicrobiia bacterium]
MTWRLSIEHITSYEYEGEVLASYNEARMSPARDATQTVLEHRVDVRPNVPVMAHVDYWGTDVRAFDLHEPHDRLIVAARSLVETAPASSGSTSSGSTDIQWEELLDANVRDQFYEYLHPSPHVPIDASIRDIAADVSRGRTPSETLDAVGTWVREHLAYEAGATDVSTNARSALDLGRGVCQDFVHVALSLLRAAGIPARYASGYLHPDADAPLDDAVTGQSHAWLEAWAGSWRRNDPTSGSAVGEQHVLVARGRDYSDVTPLKGVYNGPPSRSSEVRVTIRRVA